ncbi:RNA polymerase [Streptomyces clavuligerus]|uniref:RNA polymerase ECF-subfamily sigma factor n=1 Tax=Streptomyces clavuligerus TaxID=1901 RepID=E2Q3Y8_STRCL|nr:RNA polymerase [Streptomyces clavuligerus]EFG08926.1 RNA polymerase ECF-subfamily sigma factor [Streptomyces clavuligerus]MBY6302929.1 RNA polymerase [Streptomyces clavuligerus]QCS05785.1 RNA polymerase [Streptomyces clavuligerus]QPJ94849.1 RNA polymerase [Streptomyces clavuligerus]
MTLVRRPPGPTVPRRCDASRPHVSGDTSPRARPFRARPLTPATGLPLDEDVSTRQAVAHRRRAREFEEFVTGAAGRLLHVATLLTAERPTANPHARRLVTHALARTWARWDRLRGEDPYQVARQELLTRFARVPSGWTPWNRPVRDGVLRTLTARERLIVVLRLYESVDDEQIAVLAGLTVDRVRALSRRAVASLCAAGSPAALSPVTSPAPTGPTRPVRTAADRAA